VIAKGADEAGVGPIPSRSSRFRSLKASPERGQPSMHFFFVFFFFFFFTPPGSSGRRQQVGNLLGKAIGRQMAARDRSLHQDPKAKKHLVGSLNKRLALAFRKARTVHLPYICLNRSGFRGPDIVLGIGSERPPPPRGGGSAAFERLFDVTLFSDDVRPLRREQTCDSEVSVQHQNRAYSACRANENRRSLCSAQKKKKGPWNGNLPQDIKT